MEGLLKRRWAIAVLLLLAVIAACYLSVPVRAARISQATCDKLEIGWPTKKVVPLLQGEADWGMDLDPEDFYGVTTAWTDEDGNEIVVKFERGKGLTEKSFKPTELSVFELAKRRIERRIRALWP